MINRKANAQWNGSLKEGSGVISTQSGVLDDTPYSFVSRFEQGPQTNPEELIGAAHAACFSMALSNELQQGGFEPMSIRTQAQVTLEKVGSGWDISRIHLEVRADVHGADEETFLKFARKAKGDCPVSRLLRAEITLDAKLDSSGVEASEGQIRS